VFQSINQEVHDLRTNTLDLHSSVAECQHKAQRFSPEACDYQKLVAGRPLDPASQRRLREVGLSTSSLSSFILQCSLLF
jgi:hypothetical protein